MYAAESEVVYQFRYRGESYSVPEDDLLCCYPSLSGDGSYFFTLKDGTFLRGEQVKETIRKNVSPLERYRNFTHHYIKVKRSIGVAAGEGKSATEIIAVSGPRCWMGFDYSRGVDSSAVYGVRA